MRGNLLSVGQEGDQDEGIPGSETQEKNYEAKDLEMGEVLMNRTEVVLVVTSQVKGARPCVPSTEVCL